MKTFIFALVALLGLSLGAPVAEAHRTGYGHRHYAKHHRHYHTAYSRPSYYRSVAYPRYYGSSHYRYPYRGYYHQRRPHVSLSFRL